MNRVAGILLCFLMAVVAFGQPLSPVQVSQIEMLIRATPINASNIADGSILVAKVNQASFSWVFLPRSEATNYATKAGLTNYATVSQLTNRVSYAYLTQVLTNYVTLAALSGLEQDSIFGSWKTNTVPSNSFVLTNVVDGVTNYVTFSNGFFMGVSP